MGEAEDQDAAPAESPDMGFHPHASTFDPRSPDLVEARRAMWTWAEPVIIDRAIEIYGRIVDEAGTVAMARRHCRLWRDILFDQPLAVAPARVAMTRTAVSLGLDSAAVDDTDDAILDELLDIVMARFRSSRSSVKAYSRVLMAANSSLAAARAA